MLRKGIALVVMLLFIGTNFVTSTVSLNEKVTMATMKHPPTVLLDENFSTDGTGPNGLPENWTTDWWKWCNSSKNACCYYYDQGSAGDYYNNYITSKAIDASSYEKVTLKFWFNIDAYTSLHYYIKYRKNETSPWEDITPWDNPILPEFFPMLITIDINCSPGGCGDALQVNWTYKGYYNYFRYVYLDDVKIYSQTNNPPSAPYVTGPNNGKIGVEYNWTFVSTDPDKDNITYYIDWADECGGAEWYGPYPSGEEINIAHTYVYENTFIINTCAFDENGAPSNWTYFEVTMPKNQQFSNMWFLRWLERFPILNQIVNLLIERWI